MGRKPTGRERRTLWLPKTITNSEVLAIVEQSMGKDNSSPKSGDDSDNGARLLLDEQNRSALLSAQVAELENNNALLSEKIRVLENNSAPKSDKALVTELDAARLRIDELERRLVDVTYIDNPVAKYGELSAIETNGITAFMDKMRKPGDKTLFLSQYTRLCK